MKKLLLGFAIFLILLMSCVGCSSTTTAALEEGNYLRDVYYTYVDKETGVNYIIFAAGRKGGICPRYNADGSLYITEIKNE